MNFIKEGNHILYLWDGTLTAAVEQNVNELKEKINNVVVNVENAERISLASYSHGTFDVIIGKNKTKTSELLATALKWLKPQGRFILTTDGAEDVAALKESFILSGYINVAQQENKDIVAEKPNYEVGSSAKLSFAKKPSKPAVWKIDNDDDEIINADDLLDDEDKAVPDPVSLKVCGTTGKRKACKDCSCGLAEELDAENGLKAAAAPTQKSSCGSCYLGDAFRCASCPYLGMPAFKPGEKIQLNDQLLKADA